MTVSARSLTRSMETSAISAVAIWLTMGSSSPAAVQLQVKPSAEGTALSLDQNPPFYVAQRPLADARLIAIPNSEGNVVLWNETRLVMQDSPRRRRYFSTAPFGGITLS